MTAGARLSWASDIDVGPVLERRIAVVGYGNQGAAQACNLRDSGARVVVGNADDAYAVRAREAGFEVFDIAEAVRRSDVCVLVLPDEVQPEVFADHVAPHLNEGDALVVASGYNLSFGRIAVPPGSDVVMVAPRMVGEAVRSRFSEGAGSPALVSVERDTTGHAERLLLAFAKAAGVASPAIVSSAREEAAVDLFSEQAVWPVLTATFQAAYQVLAAHGFSNEAILYELYLSKEPAEVLALMAEHGYFEQLPLHSHTSQYGQLSADTEAIVAELKDRFRSILDEGILSGRFAERWATVLAEHPDELERMRADALASPLAQADSAVRSRLGR